MSYLYEVDGTYGSEQTASTIFCYETWCGTWYCCAGSVNVNHTCDPLVDGVDVEQLRDDDHFTWDRPINSLRQLQAAVDDEDEEEDDESTTND